MTSGGSTRMLRHATTATLIVFIRSLSRHDSTTGFSTSVKIAPSRGFLLKKVLCASHNVASYGSSVNSSSQHSAVPGSPSPFILSLYTNSLQQLHCCKIWGSLCTKGAHLFFPFSCSSPFAVPYAGPSPSFLFFTFFFFYRRRYLIVSQARIFGVLHSHARIFGLPDSLARIFGLPDSLQEESEGWQWGGSTL